MKERLSVYIKINNPLLREGFEKAINYRFPEKVETQTFAILQDVLDVLKKGDKPDFILTNYADAKETMELSEFSKEVKKRSPNTKLILHSGEREGKTITSIGYDYAMLDGEVEDLINIFNSNATSKG